MVDASQAARRVLTYLEQKLSLSESEGAGRGPWFLMAGRGATRGALRCFSASGLDKVAFLTLEDGEQLDAAMLIAFGEPNSALPHLFLDVARVGRDFAVFVDLVQRVDLAVNAAYVRGVYGPLNEVCEGLAKHPQLRASPVPHSLAPFVSPWMTGFRLAEPLLAQLFELIGPYVSHWLQLLRSGVPPVSMSGADLAARDLVHRSWLFARESDPVWDALVHVVGDKSAGRVLELLRKHGIPPSPSVPPPVT